MPPIQTHLTIRRFRPYHSQNFNSNPNYDYDWVLAYHWSGDFDLVSVFEEA